MKTILICEDDDGIVDVMKYLLVEKGYKVVALKNCSNILEDIKNKNINDLIIKCCNLENCELARMVYYPELHRLDIDEFDPKENPLYPNPQVISKIDPKNKFIKMMNPNDEYNILMKQ